MGQVSHFIVINNVFLAREAASFPSQNKSSESSLGFSDYYLLELFNQGLSILSMS